MRSTTSSASLLLAGCIALHFAAGLARAQDDAKFFRPAAVERAAIDPTGTLVALLVREQDRRVPKVVVYDLTTRARITVFDGADGPEIVEGVLRWADAEHLILSTVTRSDRGPSRWEGAPATDTLISQIQRTADGLTNTDSSVSVGGQMIDPLPDEPGVILFAPHAEPRRAYRIQIGSKLGSDTPMTRATVAAEVDRRVLHWMVDPGGQVRGAIVIDDDGEQAAVVYRATTTSEWKTLVRSSADTPPPWEPLGFSSDGEQLLIGVDRNHEQAVYEYDPRTRKRGKLVFSSPSSDVVTTLMRGGGQVAAMVTLERGVQRVHYLRYDDSALLSELETRLKRNVFIADTSRDRQSMILLVEGSSDPGAYYHLDVGTKQLRRLTAIAPWFKGITLAQVEALQVAAADGHSIDAFLALPPGATVPPPLVVLPHGGPIGAADTRHFNPEVQYLAAGGLAVLQVNYRGSAGYGNRFLASGKRQWGRGIEDDIDAALAAAVATGKVDGTRVCIAGASYGGYSALMSVIRHPRRFRCASSLAAPTDIALMVSTSDFAATAEGREGFAELVGDPDRDYFDLVRISPVYQARAIEVPIQLVHGLDDRRVDPEHAFRMKLVLEALDKEFEWEPFADAQHSGWSGHQERLFQRKRMGFLKKHLMP